MKKSILHLLAVLWLGLPRVLGHGGVELGPHGGRIVEFSKNETMYGEVTLVDGFFHVAVLDHQLKPVELKEQSLTVTGGDRSKPEKPKVEKREGHFVFPALKGDAYLLVLQFKENPKSKAINARFEFDATICSACKNPEWLCKCSAEPAKKTAPPGAKPGPQHLK